MTSNTSIFIRLFKEKLCRKTEPTEAALPAADAACVNNSEQDAADARHWRAAEVDAICVSWALMTNVKGDKNVKTHV